MNSLEVLFTPAEFAALKNRLLAETVCVVFDVLRATSSMVTALANGADGLVPVAEIQEALSWRERHPQVLLAGERDGVRIRSAGTVFDLGNSPREFTSEAVAGRTLVMTTTNGTRALRACAGARSVLVASFLNLTATASFLLETAPARLLVVCSGTHEEAALEDTLGAGALCERVWERYPEAARADSALLCHKLWAQERGDVLAAVAQSRNGRRLLTLPELRDDVAFCCRQDHFPLLAELCPDGIVRRQTAVKS